MRAPQLLRLYPSAWQQRYGDEFLELMDGQPLGLKQQFDIIMGAIDARMSWTPLPSSATVNNQEDRVMVGLRAMCTSGSVKLTKRDGMISAAMYLGLTIIGVVVGTVLRSNGMDDAGELVLSMTFPFATLGMLPMFMKGQPFRAQAVVIGTTFTILVLIAYLTALAS